MDTTITDPLIGRRLDDRYVVERRVARGGMASVYVATDSRLARQVAVKVMHPALADDEAFVARFAREARAAAALSHPNVVAVFDQGTDGEAAFLVMEYVAGRTLRDLLRERGRLTVGQALAVLDPVLAALAAAHRAGLVHRDVKPENVLLANDGQVKVADFGLARAVAEAHLTSASMIIGTAAYLAPEQYTRGVADARSDVYSAGILLYELLTGAPPFGGESPQAVASAHTHSDVPAPSARVPGIPPAVDELVRAATAREPSARPRDAAALLAQLRALELADPWPDLAAYPADTGVFTAPIPGADTTRLAPAAETARVERRRRRRWPWIAALVALLTAAAGVGGWRLAVGHTIPVPKLIGMSVPAAATTAHHLHLHLRVAAGVYDDHVGAGLVSTQQPGVRQQVADGGTITVHPSLGPVMRTVPKVTGLATAAAETAVRAARLDPVLAPEEFSSTVPAGDIIASNPPAGRSIRHGSAVTLVPSKGPAPVSVPNVTGTPLTAAEAALRAVGLAYTTTQVYSDTVPAGQVISQNPGAGVAVPPGTDVALTVSKGPQLFPIPDVQGQDVNTAIATLQQDGFHPVVRQLPGGPGIVLKQSPDGNTMARHGTSVTLYVF